MGSRVESWRELDADPQPVRDGRAWGLLGRSRHRSGGAPCGRAVGIARPPHIPDAARRRGGTRHRRQATSTRRLVRRAVAAYAAGIVPEGVLLYAQRHARAHETGPVEPAAGGNPRRPHRRPQLRPAAVPRPVGRRWVGARRAVGVAFSPRLPALPSRSARLSRRLAGAQPCAPVGDAVALADDASSRRCSGGRPSTSVLVRSPRGSGRSRASPLSMSRRATAPPNDQGAAR